MNKAVFIDTGYLLALELKSDQNHLAAKRHWQRAVAALPQLVTTSYVLNEVVTYLNSRNQHIKAVQVGNNLLRSPSVQLIHVNEALFYEGWSYFQKYQDKRYSLTDCISFVIMNHAGISMAFAFDQHFVQAGFTKSP
jgi:predicted nucleic acid-binding protein